MKATAMRKQWTAVILGVATASVASTVALGQVKTNDNGRALDANTRVGAGGYNAARPNLQLVTPNDIAYGNVTGGRGIRANLEGDPTQPFGGRSNLEMDKFARVSNATSAPGEPPLPPGVYVRPVYSSSIANAPPGFVLNPYTGQYQAQDRAHLGVADIQYGVPPGTPILRPGADADSQLILASTLSDPNNGGPVMATLTATPLLGIRQLTPLADQDQFLLSRSGSAGTMDPSMIRKLRAELAQQIAADPKLAEQFRQAEEQARLQQDAGTPANARPVTRDPINGATPSGESLNGGSAPAPLTGPNPGFLPTPKYDPADHNPVLAALRKAEVDRAAAAATKKPAPAKKADDASGKPDQPDGNARPDDTEKPPATSRPSFGSGRAPETPAPTTAPSTLGYVAPIKIGTLSSMQQQQGLKMLLEGNEKLLAEGKYASAADRYEAAAHFAPGDQMIVVARAQAELAAGFFARAEASLRAAVATDPSLLGAQYDMKKMIGENRVDQLVADLKRIALDDKSAVMPINLLAYLAYNSGDEERAIALLDEAQKRAPGDALANAMRSHWARGGGNKQ